MSDEAAEASTSPPRPAISFWSNPPWWVRDVVVALLVGVVIMLAQLTLDDRRETDAERRENLRFVRDHISDKEDGSRPYSYMDLEGQNLAWLRLVNAKLDGSVLVQANLTGTDLTKADLSHANLSNANLNYANLAEASLVNANLNDALLIKANLANANLLGAFLSEADLADAVLTGANLQDASLRSANLERTDLKGADLSLSNSCVPHVPWTPDCITTIKRLLGHPVGIRG